MILSPGNVQVERGFSVNKYVSTGNMKPGTIISHRLVYERVLKETSADQLYKFNVTKSMIDACKMAHTNMKMSL